MLYLNKFFTLGIYCALSLLPALADDIVITRKNTPGKALLDRKFIFMQGASSFKKNLSQITTVPTLVPKSKPSSNRSKTVQNVTVNNKPKADNWDDYAEEVTVELEESLNVGARLLN